VQTDKNNSLVIFSLTTVGTIISFRPTVVNG